jgi:hypothetical protein
MGDGLGLAKALQPQPGMERSGTEKCGRKERNKIRIEHLPGWQATLTKMEKAR